MRTLLLTGATGFVGQALRPALESAGWHVRCLTRDAAQARQREPGLEWIQGNVQDSETCAAALRGCQAAFYLVHGIGEGGDYHRQEVRAASTFSRAAADEGVERIVYLGGVAPKSAGSEHLRSRINVGEALRSGPVKTLELRASMIVGYGSLSWIIVRDLAARLPVMVLPRWLKSRTQPVAIDDVVVALVRSLDLPLQESAWFDLPGPDTLSGKEILEETARVMGLTQPRMLAVPFLSPRVSSLWIRFVTRAKWSVAREVVVGLTEDLLARDGRFWELIQHPRAAGLCRGGQARPRGGASPGSRSRFMGKPRAPPAPVEWYRVSRETTTAPRSGSLTLALSCIAAWLVAAACARLIGIWLAIGVTSAVLGTVVFVLDRRAAGKLLRPSPVLILLGVAAGGLMALATRLAYPVVSHRFPFIVADTARLYASFRGPSSFIAIAALAPIILGEELVWRGVVQTSLVQRLGRAGGVALAAVTYGLAHVPFGSPVLVGVAILCGFAWGSLRAMARSLVPPLVAHLVWDVLVLLWLPLDSR